MSRPGFALAIFATLLAVVVVTLGAYTRLTHAGLGCPDWPGCYGFLAVPMSERAQEVAALRFPDAPLEIDKGWNEMVHRYVAGLLGLTILVLALRSIQWRARPGQPLRLPILLLGLVILQAAFGMWTVTLKLWPQVVTAHLLGGFATLALLFLLSLRLSGRLPALPAIPVSLRLLAWLTLLLVIGQISLGGWVSANYAAMACVDLPTCQGQWWPAMDFHNGFRVAQQKGPNYLGGQLDGAARTAIHVSHRLGALLVSLCVLLLAWRLWAAGLGRLAWLLLVALVGQLALGIGNVLLHLPLHLALAHNAGGALLLLVVVLVHYRLRRPAGVLLVRPLPTHFESVREGALP